MRDDPTEGHAATAPAPDESLPHATEPRSAISGLVQKALVTFNERQRHRRVLINLLILAQALLVVAAAPGYIGERPSVAALVVVLASLFVCLLAAGFNQLGRDTTRATYVLVVGSGLAVLAQVFLAAATGTAAQAAQASLLLLTVILEAGLFFTPVLTMLLSAGSIMLTIVAFIVAVVFARSGSGRDTYGLIVGTLGLQTVTSLVAWLLAQFVYDSALESQRSQDAQFAQARLDAVLLQQAERQRQTQAVAAGVHQATARVMAGDARARVAAVEGDLGAITRDVNLLLQRLAATIDGTPSERDTPPLIRQGASEAGTVPPSARADVTASLPSPADSAASRLDLLARRLKRVQELANELTGALAHSQDGLDATASATAETQRAAGASVALAHELLEGTQHAVGLIARARLALAPSATGEHAAHDAAGGSATSADGEPVSFLGLGTDVGVAAPGLTGQFQVLPDGGLAEADTADLADLPALPGTAEGAATGAVGTPLADLPELAQALGALREAMDAQERRASTLTQDLGIISRHVRGIDGRVAWARQAIDAVRRNAERLYLTAGGATPPPAGAEDDASAMPAGADLLGPTPSRPLADALRSSPIVPPGGPEQQMASEDGDQGGAEAANEDPDRGLPD
jgi:hypothetical protein